MSTAHRMTDVFDAVFAADRCMLHHADGSVRMLPLARWRGEDHTGAERAFDLEVVARCRSATIDLGCGPGRLVRALAARNVVALGVDRSQVAVTIAEHHGTAILHRDIFDPLPREGHWSTALLIDGNIGIGDDPLRVIQRARRLIRRGGSILVEIDPDVEHVEHDTVRVESVAGLGDWFGWARVGLLGIEDIAHESGLIVGTTWQVADRHVAELVRP
ncbi:class I SAM-dependent methyltransferase [Gordonia sp. CPCC 205515]|uniref:class I SAM-dependent methyltransferase n=1 Tax=Gordonia sp. CPCC 205515 TaxID=3140791 RepID=UPI003AF3569E